MDLNAVAQDLFDELKSRYSSLTLGDEQAQVTTDPQSARFFKFSWNDNAVSMSVDEENLRLIYNKNLTDAVESEQEQEWYEFARAMKEFAVSHNLGFKPQDVEKLDLEQGDFEFLSQVNTVQESKMHGTSKTSYRPLDKTKMVIRHTKAVDESVAGSRSRNISAIFIENNQGERFRFPYNYLHGARAMQMHVAKGGNPYDAIGEAIVNSVEEIAKMRKFTQYAQRNKMVDESNEQYVDAAHIKIHDNKKLLSQIQKPTTYESAVESLSAVNEENTQDTVDALVKAFTKETFDEDLVDAFKILPIAELKGDDDVDTIDRRDVMKQASSAARYKSYVDQFVNSPESKLILKKDDAYDEFQNNLRAQQKDTNAKLGTIMRDIAGRFLSANPEDDAVSNFASDMEQQLSMSGELFSKPNPEMKALRGTAIKLANKYLTDMKRIKSDDAYKDEVRKSPEDIKAYKDIKGQEIGKGKLAKAYKRKYKGETAELEQWMDARIAEMFDSLEADHSIEESEYQDAFKKKTDQLEYSEQEPTSNSPAADKIAQTAASYGKDDMDYNDLMKAAELLRAGKLQELGKFVYGLDTDPRELIMSVIQDSEPDTFKKMYGDQDGYMSLMTPMGMEEDDMSTGTVAYGKKGKTRRATGINDNPYSHNEGEDHPALVNAALWNMKDIYQQIMAGEEIEEDDMFSYGDVLQYLDMSGIPGYEFYEDFIDTVSTAVSQAQPGGFAGQGDAVLVDKKFAPKIKTLYQQFKAATANIKGVKEDSHDDYAYTWNCKKCGTENEFSMTPQEKQEYIDDWEADNQDLVADGETGQGALDNLLLDQGEDSGLHYGDKCVKCGTEAKDPYSEDVNDILRLSGLK